MSPTDSLVPPASARQAEETHAAREYLGLVEAAFHAAHREIGHTVNLRIAGRGVRLKIAGDTIARRFLPSLAARKQEGSSRTDLTLLAWDGFAGPVTLPPCPWPLDDERVKGDLRHREQGAIRVHFQPGCDTLSLFDTDRKLGIFWTRDARALPSWEDASPFRTLFHWWADAEGLQMSHAAAAGTRDGALLMVGRGGSGKSTASILAAAAGLRFSGDDYVLIEPGEPPRVHGLYGTAKLDPPHASKLSQVGRLAVLAAPEPGEKLVFDIAASPGTDLPETQTVRALARVRVAEEIATQIVPASAASLLAALAPSTLLQLPQTGSASLARLASLVRQLPNVELRLGTDAGQIPGAITRYLEGLAAGEAARTDS